MADARECLKQPISTEPRQNKFKDNFSYAGVQDLSYLRNVDVEKTLREFKAHTNKTVRGRGCINFVISANQDSFCKIANALSYDKWTNLSTLKKKKVAGEDSILSKLTLSGLIEQNPQNKNQFRLSKENKEELEYLRDLYDPARNVRRRY